MIVSEQLKKKNGGGWNKGKKGKKATNEEIEHRTEQVVKFLLGHPAATDFEIHKQFRKRFGLHWTTVNVYAIRARKFIRQHSQMTKDEARGLGVSVLLDTMAKPNPPAVRLKAETALRAIFGYGEPTQHRVGNPDGSPLPSAVVAPHVTFVMAEKKRNDE